jgi:hypothetical protein
VVAVSLATIFDPPEWHDRAVCREPRVNPEWFYPESGMTDRPAIACCFRCPVRWVCLQEGMGVPAGIYGGTRAETRRRWTGTTEELFETSRLEAEARGLARKETP